MRTSALIELSHERVPFVYARPVRKQLSKLFCQWVGWNTLLRLFEPSLLLVDKQVFSYISSMEEMGATFFAKLLFFKVVLNLKRITNSIA